MNDKEKFLKEMEDLQVPELNPSLHQGGVKMAIMNAERSAALGVWLIAVPCYFLLCVFLYYHAHVHISWFEAMFSLLSMLTKTPWLDFIAPIVLFILPVVSIVINSLAIVHVQVHKLGADKKKYREIKITLKVRKWNLVLILISLVIICIFINYVMTENITIKH